MPTTIEVITMVIPPSSPPEPPVDPDLDLHTSLHSLLLHWYNTSKPTHTLGSSHLLSLWTSLWFAKGSLQQQIDQTLSSQYTPLLSAASQYNPDYTPTTTNEILALVILFDQIPRNVFRGTKKAYEFDELARQWGLRVLFGGDSLPSFFDSPTISDTIASDPCTLPSLIPNLQALPTHYLLTLALCFIHSESLPHHTLVSAIISHLQTRPNMDEFVFNSLRNIARNHRERVQTFGRIPERNKLLGRESTEDEKTFMRVVQYIDHV
ncbi:hypothetical protein HK102_014107 [Quaeritorhiza haematococci]|nr:hypothetical protein HK102_014107 [Quaeritorhiza haematococci]